MRVMVSPCPRSDSPSFDLERGPDEVFSHWLDLVLVSPEELALDTLVVLTQRGPPPAHFAHAVRHLEGHPGKTERSGVVPRAQEVPSALEMRIRRQLGDVEHRARGEARPLEEMHRLVMRPLPCPFR